MADEPIVVDPAGREVSVEDTLASKDELDAKEDAALEGLLSMIDGDEGAPSAPPSEPEALAAPEPTTEPKGEEAASDVDEGRRLAEAILRRDGWTAEELAGLPKETILRMQGVREKVQGDTDNAYAELTKFRATDSKVPAGERTASENEAEAVAVAAPDPKALTLSLADTLALDDEGAKTLVEGLSKFQEPLLQRQAQLEQLVRDQGLMLEKANKATLRTEADAARRELVDRFPQIADASSEGFKRVLSKMDALQRSGDYTSTAQLMEDAALLEFRSEMKAEAAEATKTLRNARANGQAHTVSTEPNKGKVDRTVSADERDDAVLDLLDQDEPNTYGARLQEAKRLGGNPY